MTNYKNKKIKIPEWEIDLSFARSSGAGGQNVNKVNTKAVLHFDIDKSKTLNSEQKDIIREKLVNRINDEGEIFMDEDGSRSQLKNRQDVARRLNDLVNEVLVPEEERHKTRVPKREKEKRIGEKKRRSQTKDSRKKVEGY